MDSNPGLMYFISKALVRFETRYQNIEKVVLVLVTSSGKLQRYFLAHVVIVHTDLPLKQILHRPNLTKLLTKWSFKMSEFHVLFVHREALKAQLLVNFIA